MTAWHVDWENEAEDELTRIWLRSNDRAAVTIAQARIDDRLSKNPISYGRHLSEGLYRLDFAPLACTFELDISRRNVMVTWVWTV